MVFEFAPSRPADGPGPTSTPAAKRSCFWQHNRGFPGGVAHLAEHLHRYEIDRRGAGGVGVGPNPIRKAQLGRRDQRVPGPAPFLASKLSPAVVVGACVEAG